MPARQTEVLQERLIAMLHFKKLTLCPVNKAISFKFLKTLDAVSFGGANMVRWVERLACNDKGFEKVVWVAAFIQMSNRRCTEDYLCNKSQISFFSHISFDLLQVSS